MIDRGKLPPGWHVHLCPICQELYCCPLEDCAPQDIFCCIRCLIAEDMSMTKPKIGKNPAAVTLGRLGGLKGGNARAAKLTARRRSQIARMGGFARGEKL